VTINAHNDNRRVEPKVDGRIANHAKNINEIKKMYLSGSGVVEISKRTGVHRDTVVDWLKKDGIYEKSKKPVTAEQKEAVIEMYARGVLTSKISTDVGISRPSILLIVSAAGIKRNLSEAASLRSSGSTTNSNVRGRQGAFHSSKSGVWIPTSSTFEYARLIQLEANDKVLNFDRSRDLIPYESDGKKSTYNPDLIVRYTNGTVVVEEIKPSDMVTSSVNSAKFKAARRYYNAKGIEFNVITESDIGKENIKNTNYSGLNAMPDHARKQAEKDRAKRYRDSLSPDIKRERNERDVARQRVKKGTLLQKSDSKILFFDVS
jgi:hypothetical protein